MLDANELDITSKDITIAQIIAATKNILAAQAFLVKKEDGIPEEEEQEQEAIPQEEITIPEEKDTLKYAEQYFKLKDTATAKYYYSDEIDLSLVEKYESFFEEQTLPYLKEMFPRLQQNVEKPNFILLGNEHDASTIAFIQLVFQESILPTGWYNSKDNTVVMTQLGHTAPYETVNTVLLPHEFFHWLKDHLYGSGIPTWFNEGLAYNVSWSSYEKTTNFLSSSLYGRQKAILLENMDSPLNIENRAAYCVFTAYVQGIYGQQKIEQLLIRSHEDNFETAFKSIYGKTVDEMYIEAKTYVQRNK